MSRAKPKRGGARSGAGRRRLSKRGTTVGRTLSLTPEADAALKRIKRRRKGSLSDAARHALVATDARERP